MWCFWCYSINTEQRFFVKDGCTQTDTGTDSQVSLHAGRFRLKQPMEDGERKACSECSNETLSELELGQMMLRGNALISSLMQHIIGESEFIINTFKPTALWCPVWGIFNAFNSCSYLWSSFILSILLDNKSLQSILIFILLSVQIKSPLNCNFTVTWKLGS